jgi:hypothetical protein
VIIHTARTLTKGHGTRPTGFDLVDPPRRLSYLPHTHSKENYYFASPLGDLLDFLTPLFGGDFRFQSPPAIK